MLLMASLQSRRLCHTKVNWVRWSCDSCAEEEEEPNMDEIPYPPLCVHARTVTANGYSTQEEGAGRQTDKPSRTGVGDTEKSTLRGLQQYTAKKR